MYLSHFGLRERPFSNTPDPRFVYLGPRHEEALAHLLFGVQEQCGFVQLTGEVGTGKTTVSRVLLERLPEGVDAALILNPVLTPEELLATLCDELGVKYETQAPSRKLFVDALYRHLLASHAAGRRTVLIVDEAQNLGVEALEQLRLLTNLETEKQKLLQIILIGQPELIDLLARRELRQLAQRVSARYHLQPFVESETAAYVRHRLALAGASADLFDARALREVHRRSGGVPRLINAVCDRALLGAYAGRRPAVDVGLVRRAAGEALGTATRPAWRQESWQRVTAAVLAVMAVVVWAAVLSQWMPHVPRLARSVAQRSASAGSSSSAIAQPPLAESSVAPPSAPAAAPASAPDLPARPVAAAPVTAPAVAASAGAPPVAASVATPPFAADVATRPRTLAEVLQSGELPTDRRAAFASLFAHWRLDVRAWAVGPCEAAASVGLRCLDLDGGWSRLRRLDLPAVLKLQARDGAPRWAPVIGLGRDTVDVGAGERVVKILQRDIDAMWDGRFVALWQPPPLPTTEIAPGGRGKAVVWLRQRLDALDGAARTTKGDVYDEPLAARVTAFQRSQSLRADGIAGVETLARLGALVDQRIPSLSRATR